MTPTQALGALLVALPFLGLVVVCVREIGARRTLGVFALVAAVWVAVAAGFWLLVGGR